MTEPTLLKKITVKSIAGIDRTKTKEEVIAIMKKLADEKPDFMAVAGDITGHGRTATQHGESTFLIGNFIAINRNTGESFKASKAFLPKDITDAAVARFDSRDKAAEGVHFHAVISVIKDPSSATGYTYISQPIKSPESINRDAELLGKLTSLPAPKQLTKKSA